MTAAAITINPLQSAKVRFVCAAVVFLLSLALYTWTLAPTVTLVDSGELITTVQTLGVAHPPGFPLYVLLARIASLFPMGSAAARVNFASALFAAFAASMLTLVVAEMLLLSTQARLPKRSAQKQTGRARN